MTNWDLFRFLQTDQLLQQYSRLHGAVCMGPGMRPLSHERTRALLTYHLRSTSERTPMPPSSREAAAPSCNGLMTKLP